VAAFQSPTLTFKRVPENPWNRALRNRQAVSLYIHYELEFAAMLGECSFFLRLVKTHFQGSGRIGRRGTFNECAAYTV